MPKRVGKCVQSYLGCGGEAISSNCVSVQEPAASSAALKDPAATKGLCHVPGEINGLTIQALPWQQVQASFRSRHRSIGAAMGPGGTLLLRGGRHCAHV